jgi:hypothetical protein
MEKGTKWKDQGKTWTSGENRCKFSIADPNPTFYLAPGAGYPVDDKFTTDEELVTREVNT